MSIFRRLSWHPFLLGIYPVIALLANNIDQIMIQQVLRSLVVAFFFTLLLYFVVWLWLRERNRATLICTLGIVLFYSYGHVYGMLETVHIFGTQIGRHRYLVPLWICILAVGSWWILNRLHNSSTLTFILNLASIFVCILPTIQIISYQVRLQIAESEIGKNFSEECLLDLPPNQTPPDIYYLITDGYTRSDVLRDVYRFDNTAFIDDLKAMGFYIADRSMSNYAQTELSLASSLNLDYLQTLGEWVTPESKDRTKLKPLIINSVVRRELECLGYTIVAFETGFDWTQWSDADLYLSYKRGSIAKLQAFQGLTGFEAMLIQSSAVLVLTDAANILPKLFVPDISNPFRTHRERILFTLDRLESVPEIPGPKMVFAHIVSPHQPYVFGPNGEPIDSGKVYTLGNDSESEGPEYHFNGYRNQITYLNSRLVPLLQGMLAKSVTPPIIILQADHGGPLTYNENRMAILNAYFLPGTEETDLYDTISPVNSFRFVFNRYFNLQQDLLEDIAYFSNYKDPYSFNVFH